MVDSIRGNNGLPPLKTLKSGAAKTDQGKSVQGKGGQNDFASQLQNADKAASAKTTQKEVKAAHPGVSSGVQFSPVMHDMAKVSDEMKTERAEKVQSLKQQVAEGNYKPDLTKVAASLLYFVARGK